ncbi:MAG: hypothetical protein LBP62_07860 [Clostridiales bacterium]|jgi:hypothetical protein|nr:hypothetical protein [Clostridiales bacterium]
MGRQIMVVMTNEDEKSFLMFLRENFDFKLIVCGPIDTADEADFYHDEFADADKYGQYYILNKKFSFKPLIKQDIYGGFYVGNLWDGPLVEFRRRQTMPAANEFYGRFYLNTCAAVFDCEKNGYGEFKKDLEEFHNRIVKWVKKNAGGKLGGSRQFYTYLLPDAWEKCRTDI